MSPADRQQAPGADRHRAEQAQAAGLGDGPGEPLPDLLGFKNPKRNGRNNAGDRPPRTNHSKVPTRFFRRIDGIDTILETLFGPLPVGAAPVVPEDAQAAR